MHGRVESKKKIKLAHLEIPKFHLRGSKSFESGGNLAKRVLTISLNCPGGRRLDQKNRQRPGRAPTNKYTNLLKRIKVFFESIFPGSS